MHARCRCCPGAAGFPGDPRRPRRQARCQLHSRSQGCAAGPAGQRQVHDGSYWLLTDNGFGSKADSPDATLFLNRYAVDFKGGSLKRLETVLLHDPDRKVPFRIIHEGTKMRYLTGSDFDTESFQVAAGFLDRR